MIRNLDDFTSGNSFGSKVRLGLWRIIQRIFFENFFFPSALRIYILRLFGASVSGKVKFRTGVKVHDPRNLKIGRNCWIGERVWFINHELITIGSNVCISQEAIICSSSHDMRDPALQYKHKAIDIHDGAWIALRAIVLSGSSVGTNSVIASGEVFSGKIGDAMIYRSGKARNISGY